MSPWELDVLAQVALGCTNAEAAQRLSLQPETVSSYLRSAAAKLGACTRHEAVSKARKSGAASLTNRHAGRAWAPTPRSAVAMGTRRRLASCSATTTASATEAVIHQGPVSGSPPIRHSGKSRASPSTRAGAHDQEINPPTRGIANPGNQRRPRTKRPPATCCRWIHARRIDIAHNRRHCSIGWHACRRPTIEKPRVARPPTVLDVELWRTSHLIVSRDR